MVTNRLEFLSGLGFIFKMHFRFADPEDVECSSVFKNVDVKCLLIKSMMIWVWIISSVISLHLWWYFLYILFSRAVTESINQLINVCTVSAPGQKECDNALRQIQVSNWQGNNTWIYCPFIKAMSETLLFENYMM